jgi:hypothetical protein
MLKSGEKISAVYKPGMPVLQFKRANLKMKLPFLVFNSLFQILDLAFGILNMPF